MFERRRNLRTLAALLFLSCSLLPAGSQTPAPRIQGRISDSARTVLRGSRSPLADAGEDLGPLPSARRIAGMALVFTRSVAQQSTLDELLAAQADKTSSRYHRWLTPGAFAARFGMSDTDLAAARVWLTSQGFTVSAVPPNRDRILFTGSVGQIKAAFGAELHSYDLNGERHFGPSTDLTLPSALGPVTAAVLHLSDLGPRPNSHPLPLYTDSSTGTHFLTPADLGIMYDLHGSSSDGLTGLGQSVAIVGASYVDLSLFGLNTFASASGHSINASLVLVPDSGVEATSPGNLAESQLDLEYAAGTAPDARMFLVFVGDSPNMGVFDALDFAIQQNIAPVISISYDLCETLLSSSEAAGANALFQQAAAQGQTLVAAAGDSGSTDCSAFSSPSLTATQKAALSVGFPASNPYVTAVGGTQMAPNTFPAGENQFWSGTSTPQKTSLLSYVPEVVWNEGSASHGVLAGGGGASTLFGRPTWQSAFPSVPSGTGRLLPDVALQSSTGSPGFLLCTNDISFVGQDGIDSCYNYDLNHNGYYAVGGGTSFAAPVFAGSVALLNQFEQEQGQGALNATLYQLAANPTTYAASFHDITSGGNGCVNGAPGCTASGQAGFAAGVGFDEATGLGSVDFAHLRAAWPANASRNPALESLDLSCDSPTGIQSVSISSGDTVQTYCQLQPYQSVYPPESLSGSIFAFVDQVPLGDGAALPLTAGPSANIQLSFPAPGTTGSHLLQVVYPGDATHLPLTLVTPFMVGSVQASGTFALTASDLTMNSNAAGVASVTISPGATNGYHGELYWSLSATQTSGSSSPQLCYSISPVRVNGITTARLSLGAGTTCGSPLPSATAAPRLLLGVPRVPSGGPRAALGHPSGKRSLPLFATLLGLGIWGLGKRRRLAGLTGLACLALLAALPLLSGCGGGSTTSGTSGGGSGSSGGSGGSGTPAAQPAVFTLTLYARDSVSNTVGANTTLTLTVN